MEFFANLHMLGNWGLLALRIALAAVFLVHGKSKWAMWKMQPSDQMPKKMLSMMKFLSVVEPLGGLAVLFGFLTQLGALGLGLVMISSLWFKLGAWKTPFTAQDKLGWEFDLVLLAICVALFFFGGGSFALDRIIFGL
ncbi:DoxX family protein [Patescibacteria group bacterium AH-259-L07]|nr:DoxX family protein [Patescibacteria group bacterium AH-259-L07]